MHKHKVNAQVKIQAPRNVKLTLMHRYIVVFLCPRIYAIDKYTHVPLIS